MNKIAISYLLIIMTLWLVACSTAMSIESVNVIATNSPMANIVTSTHFVPTIIPLATPTFSTTSTIVPVPIEPTVPTITSPPTILPTLETHFIAECPTLIDPSESALWANGNILFNSGKIRGDTFNDLEVEVSGIWAISANTLSPQLIYDDKGVWISPSGYTLLGFDRNEDTQLPQLTFYDMKSGEFTYVALPADIIGFAPEWLPDGRVRTAFMISQTLSIGEVWDVLIVDPITQSVERLTQEFILPEYDFYEYDAERGIPTGFVSVDPTYQRVLYTAKHNLDHEVRLLDLATGEILWRSYSESLVNTFPQWSQDGQRVLFELAVAREDIPPETSGDWNITFAWNKLVSLSRDGQEEELPYQPYPSLLDQILSNFSRSPDGRFIFYSVVSYAEGTSRGYIVDIETGQAGEICDPESQLVSGWPNDSIRGYWLPNGQFVYRSLVEKDGQSAHSLRVLDIPTWTTQIIFEAEPGYGVNIFGWTPVEFP